jgi:murein DD-endopeptidase MepM/ murein hydrolase activator NlpD
MTDRVAFVQSIASAGNAVVSDLEEARADLENAKARLAAAREQQQELRTAAAEALADIEAKEQAASLAEQQVTMVVTLRELALAAALEAKKVDQARYQIMRVQSGRLGSRIIALAAALDAGKRPPKGSGAFVLPSTGAETSPFGPRLHPILNYVKIHTGLDLGVGDGFAYAADDGVVIITELNVAYGNMTVIYHGKRAGVGMATLYAHQAAIGVKPGDRVRKGQPIGVIGSTGYSTGPHLHFEVFLDGRQVDPELFLDGAQPPAGTR